MMDGASVRWAQPGDAAFIAGLIQQLLDHYRQPVPSQAECLAAADAWLSGEPGMAKAALAFAGSDCCGIAVTARLWPAEGIASALMIKELFVSKPFRRQGIGKLILGFLARHCAAEGIARMDLTTEDWNTEAVRFYERNGATTLARKVYLRFDWKSISGLVADD